MRDDDDSLINPDEMKKKNKGAEIGREASWTRAWSSFPPGQTAETVASAVLNLSLTGGGQQHIYTSGGMLS